MALRSGVIVVTAALMVATVPASASALASSDGKGKPTVGKRTLGDPLFPQIGNGGYDVDHYRIYLNYDPTDNVFKSAKTTIRATADRKLKRFSLDFQDLDVSSVKVDGRPARFKQVDATPVLSSNPVVTQPMKLVVTPRPSSRPKAGRNFTVKVKYSGTPKAITDADESVEGWIRACYPLAEPQTCDGSFVVNEPIGAQSWFPSNNYPSDKATFRTLIRVPKGKTALGIGENIGNKKHRDGTVTWRWLEDAPTATYLTTATVGDFKYVVGSMREKSTGRSLPVYNAVDSSATAEQADAVQASLDQAPGQLNFLSRLYGPYPFDSTGAVADRAAGVGYALEVQGKPHYAGNYRTGDPSINVGTQLHELAHQWFGNRVTLQTWADIWFNEGWANWSTWYWSAKKSDGKDPAALFDDLYASTPAEDWEIAPAILGGDPSNLFEFFPTYQRGAMTLQGYREIVGDAKFFGLSRKLGKRYAYSNINTAQFIRQAKKASGLKGAKRALLDDYFEQWLYGETKPTILPENFA
ncbi:MAG: M1 family metallopeptidase [Candidatus Nanopelagicales bacterium]